MLTAFHEGWTTVLMRPDERHLPPVHTGHMSPRLGTAFWLENFSQSMFDLCGEETVSEYIWGQRNAGGEEHSSNTDPENV